LLLAERPHGAPGSAVLPVVEGTRPLLVEVQALVSRSALAMPRRTTLGLDSNRTAVGVRVQEPAADLAIIAAIGSSAADCPLPSDLVLFGEVGLTGEVRAVRHAETRLREAEKLGFAQAVIPAATARQAQLPPGLRVDGVHSVRELWDLLFARARSAAASPSGSRA
jgi:DNA repair protein RadA/Sms